MCIVYVRCPTFMQCVLPYRCTKPLSDATVYFTFRKAVPLNLSNGVLRETNSRRFKQHLIGSMQVWQGSRIHPGCYRMATVLVIRDCFNDPHSVGHGHQRFQCFGKVSVFVSLFLCCCVLYPVGANMHRTILCGFPELSAPFEA